MKAVTTANMTVPTMSIGTFSDDRNVTYKLTYQDQVFSVYPLVQETERFAAK